MKLIHVLSSQLMYFLFSSQQMFTQLYQKLYSIYCSESIARFSVKKRCSQTHVNPILKVQRPMLTKRRTQNA